MIAPIGTNPASRQPKTQPAAVATQKPQSEPYGTSCGTYHQASRPSDEPKTPNHLTVRCQPILSPIHPNRAFTPMFVA